MNIYEHIQSKVRTRIKIQCNNIDIIKERRMEGEK